MENKKYWQMQVLVDFQTLLPASGFCND